jgi:GT2 family glycosyltransferase
MDSDMVPAADALTRLLRWGDLDIVHAVCCRRTPPYGYCTWDLDGKQFTPPLNQEISEVAACGMAFTLIRRRVFQTMPYPWFEVGKGEDATALYEDIWFCRKARRLGFRIWADPTATVWHLAQHAVAPGPDGFPKVISAGDTMPQIQQVKEETREPEPVAP